MGHRLIWGMGLVPGIKVSSGQLLRGVMAPLSSGGPLLQAVLHKALHLIDGFPLTLAIYLKLILFRTSGLGPVSSKSHSAWCAGIRGGGPPSEDRCTTTMSFHSPDLAGPIIVIDPSS